MKARERALHAAAILVAFGVGAIAINIIPGGGGTESGRFFPDRVVSDWPRYIDGGHRLGPMDAEVTVVVFGDYECPACRMLEQSLRRLRVEYPTILAVVYRSWPLTYHKHSYFAARAAECAAAHNGFEAVHDWLYANGAWMTAPDSAIATMASLIPAEFKSGFEACVNETRRVRSIDDDIETALALGGTGTPLLLINDALLDGAVEYSRLRLLVEKSRAGFLRHLW